MNFYKYFLLLLTQFNICVSAACYITLTGDHTPQTIDKFKIVAGVRLPNNILMSITEDKETNKSYLILRYKTGDLSITPIDSGEGVGYFENVKGYVGVVIVDEKAYLISENKIEVGSVSNKSEGQDSALSLDYKDMKFLVKPTNEVCAACGDPATMQAIFKNYCRSCGLDILDIVIPRVTDSSVPPRGTGNNEGQKAGRRRTDS